MNTRADGVESEPTMTVETVEAEHHVEERPTNRTLASLAFVAGLISVIGGMVCLMFPPLNWVVAGLATVAALWMGFMALQEKGGGRVSRVGRKFAIAGIVLGLLGPVALTATLLLSKQEALSDIDDEASGLAGPSVDPLEERQSEPPVRKRGL